MSTDIYTKNKLITTLIDDRYIARIINRKMKSSIGIKNDFILSILSKGFR
jgi:hypothetical protein